MKEENRSMTAQTGPNATAAPVFVDAQTMFDKLAKITRETAEKAFEFFRKRDGDLGGPADDWFKAESDLLKPVPVEISETTDTIDVRAEVPGFKPEEIEVSIKDNLLFLSGESTSEEKKEGENTFYSERRSNRFCRQLVLPAEVEKENAKTRIEDGVLKMSLRKKNAEEAEKVSVQAA